MEITETIIKKINKLSSLASWSNKWLIREIKTIIKLITKINYFKNYSQPWNISSHYKKIQPWEKIPNQNIAKNKMLQNVEHNIWGKTIRIRSFVNKKN